MSKWTPCMTSTSLAASNGAAPAFWQVRTPCRLFAVAPVDAGDL
jgi:hypothetical protein